MMEQFNATPSSPRVMFDEEGYNGLVLCDKYLPREVLIEIFYHVDCKTLLRCQLVCKRWKMLMDNFFWHKKTERTLGKPFPWNDNTPLHVYYLTCVKNPYERNLVRNHFGLNFMDYCGSCGRNCRDFQFVRSGEIACRRMSAFSGTKLLCLTCQHSRLRDWF